VGYLIKSLNAVIDDKQLDVFMQELEERDEMICFFNACGAQAGICVGNACGIACIGIGPCLVGVHVG